MCQDCLLSVAVHESLLPAECLDAEISKRPLSIKATDAIPVLLSNLGHGEETYDIFAYAVWYVRQLKFLVLRQNRKLEDEEARSGPILVWNQLRTKVSFCSSA